MVVRRIEMVVVLSNVDGVNGGDFWLEMLVVMEVVVIHG